VQIPSAISGEYFEGRPNFEDVFMSPNFSARRYKSNESMVADPSKCHSTLVTKSAFFKKFAPFFGRHN
jgi:hypothetical protein